MQRQSDAMTGNAMDMHKTDMKRHGIEAHC
nr:MAG TPA: hypothetical protein [Caudoviricetes sp.]